jgi:hypothetical protein
VTMPAGQSTVSFYVRAISSGSSGVSISSTGYTTYTNTVTVAP